MIVTGGAIRSPLASKRTGPMMPSLMRVARSWRETEARVPSERAMASSRTSVAAAA
jgi:hypothetical protein